MLAAIEGTLQASVASWAAEQRAQTGSVPGVAEALRRWANTWLQGVYVPMGLLAVAGFGWSLLATRMVPSWIGWGSIGWGFLWLAQFLRRGATAPAVVFVPPLIIGFALVARG